MDTQQLGSENNLVKINRKSVTTMVETCSCT